MSRSRRVGVLVLLAAPALSACGGRPPAADASPPVGPGRSVGATDVSSSFTERALALFAAEEPGFDVRRTRQRIDALAAEALLRLRDIPEPAARVEALNRYFFEENRFEADDDLEDPDNLYPDQVLRRRRGYCTGLAFLYAAIAERLQMPVYGVNTPEHMFLRYDDGVVRRNIETLAGGRDVPDDHYRERDRIDERSVARGVFLTNLDDERFLSQIANNLGTIHSHAGQTARARRLYRLALELDPDNPTAHYNLARERMSEGELVEAAAGFSRAIELHPNHVQALNNRGVCRIRLGDPDGAVADFLAALAIDPSSESARRNLERLAREPPG